MKKFWSLLAITSILSTIPILARGAVTLNHPEDGAHYIGTIPVDGVVDGLPGPAAVTATLDEGIPIVIPSDGESESEPLGTGQTFSSVLNVHALDSGMHTLSVQACDGPDCETASAYFFTYRIGDPQEPDLDLCGARIVSDEKGLLWLQDAGFEAWTFTLRVGWLQYSPSCDPRVECCDGIGDCPPPQCNLPGQIWSGTECVCEKPDEVLIGGVCRQPVKCPTDAEPFGESCRCLTPGYVFDGTRCARVEPPVCDVQVECCDGIGKCPPPTETNCPIPGQASNGTECVCEHRDEVLIAGSCQKPPVNCPADGEPDGDKCKCLTPGYEFDGEECHNPDTNTSSCDVETAEDGEDCPTTPSGGGTKTGGGDTKKRHRGGKGHEHEGGEKGKHEEGKGHRHEGGEKDKHGEGKGRHRHDGGKNDKHQDGKDDRHQGGEDDKHEGRKDDRHQGGKDDRHQGGKDDKHQGRKDDRHQGGKDDGHQGGKEDKHQGGKGDKGEGANDDRGDD